MIVVSNSTPLIALASIGKLNLLQAMFKEISIPDAVYEEVVTNGRTEGNAKEAVISAPWIKRESIRSRGAADNLLEEVDSGEAEAIVLAHEIGAAWLLMNERKGRAIAKRMGQNKIGTLGLLLKAKEAGLINAVRHEIDLLRRDRFSVSEAVITEILRVANEL